MATRPDPCWGWILLPAQLRFACRWAEGLSPASPKRGTPDRTPSSDAVKRSGARASLDRGLRVFGIRLVKHKRFDNLK